MLNCFVVDAILSKEVSFHGGGIWEIGGRFRELATWKSLAIEVPAAWESRRGSPIDQFNLEYISEWVDDNEYCKFVVFSHLIFHGETCFHCMRIFRLVS